MLPHSAEDRMSTREYLRDGRSPIPALERTSRAMSSNRAKDTRPEVMLRSSLWANGVRGYRLHWKRAPGRPDIAFPAKKKAIFVHGCFWHRCPYCALGIPKSHSEFWIQKFLKNQERDQRKISRLITCGWNVLVIWECQIKRNTPECVHRVIDFLAC